MDYDYRYVLEYDTQTSIDKKIIEDALYYAWKNTPSKNNFMPYSVHVLGPDKADLKQHIYWKCLANQIKANYKGEIASHQRVLEYEKEMYSEYPPAYKNIVSAEYVLIFTQRVEDQPNHTQQEFIKMGYVYEQTIPRGEKYMQAGKVATLEIGMFSSLFSLYCLNNGVDISHTLCFPKNMALWREPQFKFIDSSPILIMTAGKGKRYRRDTIEENEDLKPDYQRIVKYYD